MAEHDGLACRAWRTTWHKLLTHVVHDFVIESRRHRGRQWMDVMVIYYIYIYDQIPQSIWMRVRQRAAYGQALLLERSTPQNMTLAFVNNTSLKVHLVIGVLPCAYTRTHYC